MLGMYIYKYIFIYIHIFYTKIEGTFSEIVTLSTSLLEKCTPLATKKIFCLMTQHNSLHILLQSIINKIAPHWPFWELKSDSGS